MLARIKVGDLVQVISGKDRSRRGEVIALSKDKLKVKVRGIALVTKFKKSSKVGSKAKQETQLIKEERFIYSCKVMPICPGDDKPCRVKVGVGSSGEKIRVSVRSELKV